MAENEKEEKQEKNSYSAKNLEVLEGLDAVRMRPGMYIGSTGVKGLHHILWEIVDNAIDEAANGYANKIKVVLYKDGSASVEDNGRGIPTDIHPKEKVSGVQLVFTKLHAGGKFGQGNYQYSGGLHGVGASVTNALSEWLQVEVRHGTVYKMSFRSFYNARKKKYESGIPDGPLENTGVRTKLTGTTVRFKPDAAVFSETNFDLDTVEERLNELAFLNRGLEITLTDERITMADAKRMRGNIETDEEEQGENAENAGETEGAETYDRSAYTPHDLFDEADAAMLEKEPYSVMFKYDGGISDFVRSLNEEKKKLYPTPVYYKTVKNDISIEFAVQHTTEYTESIFSFVNNIPTPEGGYHEAGFRSGIAKAFNDYARSNGFLKEKDANFQGDDFREGLTAVLSVKMREVQFEGQTKTKLGNTEARPAVEAGENLGFLPGDLQEKVDPYLRPLYDALQEMFGAEQYEKLMERGVIEVAPLAYMRGRTLSSAFIILDEAQNTTREQMKMFLTRMGEGSKAVVTGDATQVDLPRGKSCGLTHAANILKDVEGVQVCMLSDKDVVRHPLVMRIVKAYEKDEEREEALAREREEKRRSALSAARGETLPEADGRHKGENVK